jgi:hypothetical protein
MRTPWKTPSNAASAPMKQPRAGRAFRQLMPPLSGHENIRNFIACAAQGILMDVISGSDGARLLYAAQVAHSTMTPSSHSRKSTPIAEPTAVPESKSERL